ncbi:hypothetical protein Acsp04_17110 [Actinomadura sp. NBRC 104425]|nr:hypothetical protein Acsp04_17110 [Actinomadura sp. NBRC 104425]
MPRPARAIRYGIGQARYWVPNRCVAIRKASSSAAVSTAGSALRHHHAAASTPAARISSPGRAYAGSTICCPPVATAVQPQSPTTGRVDSDLASVEGRSPTGVPRNTQPLSRNTSGTTPVHTNATTRLRTPGSASSTPGSIRAAQLAEVTANPTRIPAACARPAPRPPSRATTRAATPSSRVIGANWPWMALTIAPTGAQAYWKARSPLLPGSAASLPTSGISARSHRIGTARPTTPHGTPSSSPSARCPART